MIVKNRIRLTGRLQTDGLEIAKRFRGLLFLVGKRGIFGGLRFRCRKLISALTNIYRVDLRGNISDSRGSSSTFSMPTPSTEYFTAVSSSSTRTGTGPSPIACAPGFVDLAGSSEFNPCGITGTIAIKMMSSTSMSGVTLISERGHRPVLIRSLRMPLQSSPNKNWASEHSILQTPERTKKLRAVRHSWHTARIRAFCISSACNY